ncbi:MAG TPA: histidine kinase [Gaiellaceae bacterium]|nr:histidine kinase [Gaiellaceae bacterium]
MTQRARLAWYAVLISGPLFVVFGELGFWLHGVTPRETFPLDLGVSSLAIASGLVLWRLRPDNRIGFLLALAGILWTIGGIRAYRNPWAFGVGQCFDGAQDLVFAHLLVAYPSGRLQNRWLRALVVAGYGIFVLNVLETITVDVPRRFNAFAIWHAPTLNSSLDTVGSVAAGVYAASAIVIFCARWLRASSSRRRVLGPVLLAALFLAVSVGVDQIVDGTTGSEPAVVFFPPLVARLLIPIAFLFGLARARLDRVAVGDLVRELDASGAGTMQSALARVLHDPGLRVGYRLEDRDEFVDSDGLSLALPADDGHHAVTYVTRGDAQLAAIVHERALLEHPELIDAVSAAVGLALDNDRLHAQLRSQLQELRASRARLVRAADSERRRLERDLHDGAQQRLLALGLALNMLRARASDTEADQLLAEAEEELASAVRELRELARGIHPAILTDQGLAAAARTLATRSAVPIEVVANGRRFPPAVETAGYYVIAEALANITRYSGASRARIEIGSADGLALIVVEDDGVGGADPRHGTGLAGLADRVGALDGSLVVQSTPGAGTTIRAEIPCV